ncbi:hypothetical protein [Nocardioides pacificus]
MTHRLGARLLSVALLTTIALGVPAAAQADRSVTRDAARDAIVVDSAEDLDASHPAPSFTSVDIVRTIVDHRAARLRVSVRYRDLRRTPIHSTMFRIATPQAPYWLTVDRALGEETAELTTRRGRVVTCEGLRWSADTSTERVSATVPAGCIGSPRWVRIGSGAISAGPGAVADLPDFRMYADDGHRTGTVGDTLRLGRRVSRG